MVSVATSLRRSSIWGIFALAAILSVYLIAALIGSIIPVNQQWRGPDDGIELFVETNGVHSGIVMPIVSDVHDWRDLIRPEQLADPSQYGSHISIGWGHAGVYRHAEHWGDLRLVDAASAILGSDETLIHIYHLNYPQAYPYYRRSIRVSEDQYRKLVAAIRPYFLLGADQQPLASAGYGVDDLFYQSNGHYSALNTCNVWTGDMLAKAGIRTGLWTPFQGGVMRWFHFDS